MKTKTEKTTKTEPKKRKKILGGSITIRVSQKELEMVENQAETIGMSVSSYIRHLIHKNNK
jgi:predicted DNA binding CopG/RHH family protein